MCSVKKVFVFPGPRTLGWPPAPAPNLYLSALVPNLDLPMAPDLYLPVQVKILLLPQLQLVLFTTSTINITATSTTTTTATTTTALILVEKQYSFNVSEHYINFISTYWYQCPLVRFRFNSI